MWVCATSEAAAAELQQARSNAAPRDAIVCPYLYCCSFFSAHSVCYLLSHTPLNVPCWAPGPLAKVKRALGNCSRNLVPQACPLSDWL
jgi:hypothetical protein